MSCAVKDEGLALKLIVFAETEHFVDFAAANLDLGIKEDLVKVGIGDLLVFFMQLAKVEVLVDDLMLLVVYKDWQVVGPGHMLKEFVLFVAVDFGDNLVAVAVAVIGLLLVFLDIRLLLFLDLH